MIREPRYFVLKHTDIKKYLGQDEVEALERIWQKITEGRKADKRPYFNGVVVEQDWPEFEPVWAMLESRMDSTPLPIIPSMERRMELAYASINDCVNEALRLGNGMSRLDIFKWHVRQLLRKFPYSMISTSANKIDFQIGRAHV